MIRRGLLITVMVCLLPMGLTFAQSQEDITIRYIITDDQPFIGGISHFQLFITNNMDEPIVYGHINVTATVTANESLLTQWSEEIVYIAPHGMQWVAMWFLWEYPQYNIQITVYADNVKPAGLEFVLFLANYIETVTEHSHNITTTHYANWFTTTETIAMTTETVTVREFEPWEWGILILTVIAVILTVVLRVPFGYEENKDGN